MREPYNLGLTLGKAIQALAKKEPEHIAKATNTLWDSKSNLFAFQCLTTELIINGSSWEIVSKSGKKIDPITQILVLHYLNTDSYVSLTGQLISFKELPGAFIYQEPFAKRTINPLAKAFGNKPGKLISAGLCLQGVEASYKDESIVIFPFPMVPLTFVLHHGDEEFPPTGNILFDSSVSNYLFVEDCTVLASWVVRELITEGLNT